MKSMEREHTILRQLNRLPKKILLIHGYENVPEFILYDLCQEHCFNLRKAAYLVDNPDFNYCKGVAGFSRNECCVADDIWQNPETFSRHMKKCKFHQQIRLFERPSIGGSVSQMIESLPDNLGFKQPAGMIWNMKHDNHGILIYETEQQDELHDIQDHLDHSVYLFGFCPVY